MDAILAIWTNTNLAFFYYELLRLFWQMNDNLYFDAWRYARKKLEK